MLNRFAAALGPTRAASTAYAPHAADGQRRPTADGSGAERGSHAPAWLPAADWPDTLPSCFRSEAFPEDLPEPAPLAAA